MSAVTFYSGSVQQVLYRFSVDLFGGILPEVCVLMLQTHCQQIVRLYCSVAAVGMQFQAWRRSANKDEESSSCVLAACYKG